MPTALNMIDCSGFTGLWTVNTDRVGQYHGVNAIRVGSVHTERELPFPPEVQVNVGETFRVQETGLDWIWLGDRWEEMSDRHTHAIRREWRLDAPIPDSIPWAAEMTVGDLVVSQDRITLHAEDSADQTTDTALEAFEEIFEVGA